MGDFIGNYDSSGANYWVGERLCGSAMGSISYNKSGEGAVWENVGDRVRVWGKRDNRDLGKQGGFVKGIRLTNQCLRIANLGCATRVREGAYTLTPHKDSQKSAIE